ncbi:hypothetical protein [Rhodospirillum sp. A1_3_36]|uniref:hypothetical protein n=1 Tax=Rhodospirillum sp. A1_3_36 TaxID=3391666 RepID=UPI0039A5DE2C
MPYSQQISRENPNLFLFLLDQSYSMTEEFGQPDKDGNAQTKANALAEAVNATISEVILRCTRGEGVREYFEIGILGYGPQGECRFAWEGGLVGQTVASLPEIKLHAAIQKYKQETVVRGRIVEEELQEETWVRPVADGGTPMKAALERAKIVVSDWIANHRSSYPPMVINITDGMATDVMDERELVQVANEIKNLETEDGNALLINCHITSHKKAAVYFPGAPEELPDDNYAKTLYEMSSVLPPQMNAIVAEMFSKSTVGAAGLRGLAYNAGPVQLIKFLDIGTRQALDNMSPTS